MLTNIFIQFTNPFYSMKNLYKTIARACIALIMVTSQAIPAYTVTVQAQCTDLDNDGICDTSDNCPDTFNPSQADSDGDGVGDACDNCVDTANQDQADSNNNGIGDVCEDVPACGNGVVDPGEECNEP